MTAPAHPTDLAPDRRPGDEPPIGLTLGDPAGVGPELALAALRDLPGIGPVRLYGPAPLVEEIARTVDRCEPCATTPSIEGIVKGCYGEASGRAALAALSRAARDLAEGSIAALVTGPMDKRAFRDGGEDSPGQTEFVARVCRVRRFAMLLAGPRLRVALVTRHLALREVPDAVTAEGVVETTRLTVDHLRRWEGIGRPRIGVLGINPHASDEGRFGDEEARILAPAIERLRSDGLALEGPLPADTAFHRAWQGEFDALVAMYHDQGLGPLKLVHFREAVNVTLGLPRLRVSPDHGPAFDRAGKGTADPTSLRQALRLAARSRGRPSPVTGS